MSKESGVSDVGSVEEVADRGRHGQRGYGPKTSSRSPVVEGTKWGNPQTLPHVTVPWRSSIVRDRLGNTLTSRSRVHVTD